MVEEPRKDDKTAIRNRIKLLWIGVVLYSLLILRVALMALRNLQSVGSSHIDPRFFEVGGLVNLSIFAVFIVALRKAYRGLNG